ncbi:FadR/GntR family transcriptional regulator [Sutterella sp.]|uniref:FadR/GntR family transcriptional regulator n=1 Tax=Sutterella sp. TaxID=1981025 RepID=UPI0026E04646|nr:FCD domain-containing protein [Sutterella sp.]MDO5530992.1 FCD domain-containing protein [Sutterella sp.]
MEKNYLSSNAPIDEDTLFRDIHKHILRQAKAGGRIDTEAEIAERFNVTRYKVRKALSVLSQMGIVDRAPKRGMTVNAMGPKHLSSQIQVQMDIANFDIREFIEARLLIEVNIIPLCVRRMTPALLGRLDDAICRIEANAGNTREADRWDREFHLILLESCGNRVLQVFSAALITYFEKTTSNLPQNDPAFFMAIARQERELLRAIQRGDEELARDLLSKHLKEQIDLLSA